jgi:PleD family two-component response regulator
MQNSESELLKNLIHERLKLVDSLVKNSRLEEAAKEISEIRKIDPKNGYALAFEERIFVLLGKPVVKEEPKKSLLDSSLPLTPSSDTHIAFDPPNARTVQPTSDEGRVIDSGTHALGISKDITKEKYTVALIDDDTLLLQALAELLEDNKYVVISFTKSEEALEYFRTGFPDIIICDVNLETSSFGGFTLHEKLRKLDHLRDVPFLFLSGLTDTAIVLAGKQLGADDYLTKPVEPEALLAVVKGKLKRYRQIKKNR